MRLEQTRLMTEDELLTLVTDLCDLLGLCWHHEVDSRRSRAGFPDLVIVGPGGVVWAELKTEKGRLRPEQREWLQALSKADAEAYVWRPGDWPGIQMRLRQLARKTVTHA